MFRGFSADDPGRFYLQLLLAKARMAGGGSVDVVVNLALEIGKAQGALEAQSRINRGADRVPATTETTAGATRQPEAPVNQLGDHPSTGRVQGPQSCDQPGRARTGGEDQAIPTGPVGDSPRARDPQLAGGLQLIRGWAILAIDEALGKYNQPQTKAPWEGLEASNVTALHQATRDVLRQALGALSGDDLSHPLPESATSAGKNHQEKA